MSGIGGGVVTDVAYRLQVLRSRPLVPVQAQRSIRKVCLIFQTFMDVSVGAGKFRS